jgi:BMFP domain-containing protein YqiC
MKLSSEKLTPIFATLGNLANSRYHGPVTHPDCINKVRLFMLLHQLREIMIDNQIINRLSEQINALLPPGLQQVKEDFDARLKTLLQQQLSHYEMVSREEFDIQARVLARTREKLEAIETRLKELEKTLG